MQFLLSGRIASKKARAMILLCAWILGLIAYPSMALADETVPEGDAVYAYHVDQNIPVKVHLDEHGYGAATFFISAEEMYHKGFFTAYTDDNTSGAKMIVESELNGSWPYGSYDGSNGYYWDKKKPLHDNNFSITKDSHVAVTVEGTKYYGPCDFEVSVLGGRPNSTVSATFRVTKHEHAALKRYHSLLGFHSAARDFSYCPTCGRILSGKAGSVYFPRVEAHIDGSPARAWTGKNVRPSVKLDYGDGVTLSGVIPASRYSVSYPAKSRAVGSYRAKVRLSGGSIGSGERLDRSGATVAYRVVPRATRVASVRAGSRSAAVRWAGRSGGNGGYQVRWSAHRSMSGARTASVGSAGRSHARLSGLRPGKRYWVQVRCQKKVGGSWYRSAWSARKSFRTNE